jgi:hypothetical protein
MDAVMSADAVAAMMATTDVIEALDDCMVLFNFMVFGECDGCWRQNLSTTYHTTPPTSTHPPPTTTNQPKKTMAKNYVHQRYLDSEERYEIFTVKAAERQHLLLWTPEGEEASTATDTNEEKKSDCLPDEDPEPLPPPLTDGCDLPGWRCKGIAPSMNNSSCKKSCIIDVDYPFQGTLNVGAGSTLFRRESMFPFICSNAISEFDESTISDDRSCWWHSAKQQLNVPPPLDRAAPVVQHKDVAVLVDYTTQKCNEARKVTLFSLEYEMKNRPVKILGATEGWTAMPDFKCDLSKSSDENSTAWMDNGEDSKLFSGGAISGWT